ncbi:MAG: hypothetical protein AAGA36_00070 [Pseudomonadota bacterium]
MTPADLRKAYEQALGSIKHAEKMMSECPMDKRDMSSVDFILALDLLQLRANDMAQVADQAIRQLEESK